MVGPSRSRAPGSRLRIWVGGRQGSRSRRWKVLRAGGIHFQPRRTFSATTEYRITRLTPYARDSAGWESLSRGQGRGALCGSCSGHSADTSWTLLGSRGDRSWGGSGVNRVFLYSGPLTFRRDSSSHRGGGLGSIVYSCIPGLDVSPRRPPPRRSPSSPRTRTTTGTRRAVFCSRT
jgi:hypothetical protein